MASSRWKRFAFFERHSLTVPSEVLEDLIPQRDADASASNVGVSRTLAAATRNDSVCLAVTSAGLPLDSKPKEIISLDTLDQGGRKSKPKEDQNDRDNAIDAMWSSLTACTSPELHRGEQDDNDKKDDQKQTDAQRQAFLQLPSQGQIFHYNTSTTSNNDEKTNAAALGAPTPSTSSIDGLVLVFVSSKESDLVHCFDVTVRCNPPSVPPSKDNSTVEDLDGWRGYFAPFTQNQTSVTETGINASTSTGGEGPKARHVVGIATCRFDSGHKQIHVASISKRDVVVWEDPHVFLSCRRPLTVPRQASGAKVYSMMHSLSPTEGNCLVVDIVPGIVAVGMDTGAVLVFVYSDVKRSLRTYLKIPPPPADRVEVVSVKLSLLEERVDIFVSYRLAANVTSQMSSAAGVCCFEFPRFSPANVQNATLSAPSARHDLDGRYVGSSSLVDATASSNGFRVTVARPDGLYSYSRTERTGVAPIEGTKLAICLVPSPVPATKTRDVSLEHVSFGYALVASTDAKSGRDAVDIYDSMNKLVAFHLLLSPGHRAVRAAGVTTFPTLCSDGSMKGGRSSAVILTSGGTLVTLTEKLTTEKISLLVQKNLYSAAIVVAYEDPSYDAADITLLYRQYAEHLYRKGDYSGAIDQYCHTIGSLESSHVIFRYLDAPKIPFLVKYLEKLRARELATPVHNELLRTCYLKLNDNEAADAIAVASSSSINKASMASILANLSSNPKEALATVCSLDTQQVAEVLVTHGPSLARVLPREIAGIVIALCLGTYSPKSLADAALVDPVTVKRMIERDADDQDRSHEPYPFSLFSSAFVENPKILRLILSHLNRNKCSLTPSLRRTLLELTLAEWGQARRSGDLETEKMRHKEAIAALTDSHCREIGDYDALVIVQLAGFQDGELLLYERLQMVPMLLERYAEEGSEKSRRQMLAMSQSEPEILADVLGHFVDLASEKLCELLQYRDGARADDASEDDEAEDILDDIREALVLARRQGVLPPVRVARILAGEGTGQFSNDDHVGKFPHRRTVPLAVALDYVGKILAECRKEISRLRSEVEEYNQLCNSMERDIDSLLRTSQAIPAESELSDGQSHLDIDEAYRKMRSDGGDRNSEPLQPPRESFWRDMNQSEDTFDTIARFFAKGVIQ